jgi:hypothetical protein
MQRRAFMRVLTGAQVAPNSMLTLCESVAKRRASSIATPLIPRGKSQPAATWLVPE